MKTKKKNHKPNQAKEPHQIKFCLLVAMGFNFVGLASFWEEKKRQEESEK